MAYQIPEPMEEQCNQMLLSNTEFETTLGISLNSLETEILTSFDVNNLNNYFLDFFLIPHSIIIHKRVYIWFVK